MPVAPGTSSAWRSWSARRCDISFIVARSTLVSGAAGASGPLASPLGDAARGRRYRLLSLAISVHRSSSPSPLVAEMGRAAIPSCRSSSLRFFTRSLRDSLSIFVASDRALDVQRLQPLRRIEIRVEPGMPGVDQVEDARDRVVAAEIRLARSAQLDDRLAARPGRSRSRAGPRNRSSSAPDRRARPRPPPCTGWPAGSCRAPRSCAPPRAVSALRSVDLPTLDRPTSTTCGIPSCGMPRASVALVTNRASSDLQVWL